jgi:DNA polymerase III delta subunit
VLSDAVAEAGGRVRRFPAMTRDRLEAWVVRRASELGIGLGPGAARLLTERVGGYVREGDVDRRRQAELAASEMEKLALLRPGGVVTRADVDELVPEAIPGSTWAFLDAVAARRTGEASRLAERLLAQAMPLPVIISQLHRRLRELLIVREHLATGARPAELVRRMRLQPYRAQKLAEQATTWAMPELEDALTGLMELDLSSKGIAPDGGPAPLSDARSALAFHVWLAERVEKARR